jgi:hypothetical protein
VSFILVKTIYSPLSSRCPRSYTDAAPVRSGGGVGDRADEVSGGLGSSGLARTGEEGPANSPMGLRLREQDRRRENGGGGALGGSG